MAIKIRLARGGSKKRPFYRIVAADSRMPRDGRFIERLGTYSPLLPKDSEERVKMNLERIQYWMGQGAQPTDRIARMLEAAGVVPATTRANPQRGEPGEKAVKRAGEKAAKATAATEAAKAAAAAPAPVEPAPVEEAAEEPAAAPAEDVAEETAAAPAKEVAEAPAEEPAAATAEEVAEEPAAEAAEEAKTKEAAAE